MSTREIEWTSIQHGGMTYIYEVKTLEDGRGELGEMLASISVSGGADGVGHMVDRLKRKHHMTRWSGEDGYGWTKKDTGGRSIRPPKVEENPDPYWHEYE